MRQFTVTAGQAGQKLFKYAGRVLPDAPGSFIHKMLRKKNITVNGHRADSSRILEEGDQVTFWLSDETMEKFMAAGAQTPSGSHKHSVTSVRPRKGEPAPAVIYEDADILVLDKPAGLLSQKGASGDWSANDWLRVYLASESAASGSDTGTDSASTFRPSVCHRLDRNTSGLIIAGKSVRGAQDISELIRARAIGKYYLALAGGRLTEEMTLKGYLSKDPSENRVTLSDTPGPGKDAVHTILMPLCSNGQVTCVLIRLITGKPHQIRAHLSGIGHPIAGDLKYGDPILNKRMHGRYGLSCLMLHCMLLQMPVDCLRLANVGGRIFTAPIPSHFAQVLSGEGLDIRIPDVMHRLRDAELKG